MTAVLSRTWQDVARQVWPGAAWVLGEGQFATVRGCGGQTTVLLHATVDQARGALRLIHPGLIRNCEQKHVFIELGVPLHE